MRARQFVVRWGMECQVVIHERATTLAKSIGSEYRAIPVQAYKSFWRLPLDSEIMNQALRKVHAPKHRRSCRKPKLRRWRRNE